MGQLSICSEGWCSCPYVTRVGAAITSVARSLTVSPLTQSDQPRDYSNMDNHPLWLLPSRGLLQDASAYVEAC